jgi:hypothetical protein
MQSNLIFQWWNIRQTSSYAFIWSDDILINAMDWKKSLERNIKRIESYDFDEEKNNKRIDDVIEEFHKLLWKEIIPIWLRKVNWKRKHDGPQEPREGFHIDLFVTPLNDEEIVVREWLSEEIKNDLSKRFKLHIIPNFRPLNYNNVLLENYNKWEIKRVYLPQYYNGRFVENDEKMRGEINYLEDLFKADERWNLSDEQKSVIERNGWLEKLKIEYGRRIKGDNYYEKNTKAREFWEKLWYEVIPVSMNDKNIMSQWSLNCRTSETRK